MLLINAQAAHAAAGDADAFRHGRNNPLHSVTVQASRTVTQAASARPVWFPGNQRPEHLVGAQPLDQQLD